MIQTDETSADENAMNPKVSLVDFGFAKRYHSSKKGHIGKNSDVAMFEGNMMFCSINQMNFYKTSRKDDLMSFCYLMLTLLNGY